MYRTSLRLTLTYLSPMVVGVGLISLFPILYNVYISFTNQNLYHFRQYSIVGFVNYGKAVPGTRRGLLHRPRTHVPVRRHLHSSLPRRGHGGGDGAQPSVGALQAVLARRAHRAVGGAQLHHGAGVEVLLQRGLRHAEPALPGRRRSACRAAVAERAEGAADHEREVEVEDGVQASG